MSVFDQLVDQQQVIKVLKDAVLAASDSGNLGKQMTHAWLFTVPAG